MDFDYLLALNLSQRINNIPDFYDEIRYASQSTENSAQSSNIVDQKLELKDPNPDIYTLFVKFNKEFFDGSLDSVEVKWSYRMTLCAGTCTYRKSIKYCSIHLSHPLLKFRPRKDLIETLLHEMIHAYLFVTNNYTDRDSHGPEFQSHMNRINSCSGTNITLTTRTSGYKRHVIMIYHGFHREVDEHRKHWWRCTGPCKERPPFHGYVKRAMNRAPSSNDYWWPEHALNCSGQFIKVKEPIGFSKNSQGKLKRNLDRTLTQTDPPDSDFARKLKYEAYESAMLYDYNFGEDDDQDFGVFSQGIVGSSTSQVIKMKGTSRVIKVSAIPGRRVPEFNKLITDYFTTQKVRHRDDENSPNSQHEVTSDAQNSDKGLDKGAKVSGTSTGGSIGSAKLGTYKRIKSSSPNKKSSSLEFNSNYESANYLLKNLHHNNRRARTKPNVKHVKPVLEIITIDSD